MEKRAFETPFGQVWLWGEREAFEGQAPVVLAIAGAFNVGRGHLFELQAELPEAAVLAGHLPGNHVPPLITHSVGVYAAAYSQVLDQLGRPAVALGASIGALVALGLRSPWLRAILAIEPPLRTGKLWPMLEPLRARLRAAPADSDLRSFVWNVFGVSEDDHQDRDYRPLLAGLRTPAVAVFAGEPLYPQRAVGALPSLVDEPERLLFQRHPLVKLVRAGGGGHAMSMKTPLLMEIVRLQLAEAAGTPAPSGGRAPGS